MYTVILEMGGVSNCDVDVIPIWDWLRISLHVSVLASMHFSNVTFDGAECFVINELAIYQSLPSPGLRFIYYLQQ
jgi:hypothetical protein